ncbi:MAG: hypothetical protein Fur005_37200 [Roseiflexaceae bacterium]
MESIGTQRWIALLRAINVGGHTDWLCRTKVSESPNSGNSIEKALKLATTLRNSTTVHKLAETYPA